MILSSLISASLVLGAHSFLVPGELDVSQADNVPALFNKEESVTLDCSTCPYALNSERHGGHEWTNDVQSDLHMKFDTEGDSIRLNGVPFYPIPLSSPPALHVSQTKKENEDSTFQGFDGDLRLSYSLEFDQKVAQDGSSLLSVTMTVLALDGQMVKIDNVEIKAIKTADGKLVLHSATPVATDPNSLEAKCGNIMCRVLAKIATTVRKAKAQVKAAPKKVKCFCVKCYKTITGAVKHIHKHPHHGKHADKTVSIKLPDLHNFRPTMIGRPMHHVEHTKSTLHHIAHVVWATIKVAIVPVMIGIAVGMAASAIGLMVGQLVVFLWMRFRKTDRVIYIPIDTDEKSGLPAYEDIPTQIVLDEEKGEQEV